MKERPEFDVHFPDKRLSSPSVETADRRASPRRAFIAEALAVELISGAKLSGRCCDLVAHGCYMDTLNPFEQGTLVRIPLQHGGETAEAKGKVVYRVPNLGMGIAFSELAAVDRTTIAKWLSQTGQEQAYDAPLPPVSQENASPSHARTEQVARLIQILNKKGILSSMEAASLLDAAIE